GATRTPYLVPLGAAAVLLARATGVCAASGSRLLALPAASTHPTTPPFTGGVQPPTPAPYPPTPPPTPTQPPAQPGPLAPVPPPPRWPSPPRPTSYEPPLRRPYRPAPPPRRPQPSRRRRHCPSR